MPGLGHTRKRKKPSVAALVLPLSGNHYVKVYWGTEGTPMPVYSTTKEALERHPAVSVFIDIASFRSVRETSMEAMNHSQVKTSAIIAEGAPEQQAREFIKTAEAAEVGVMGPARVGGIKPGRIRIGNIGGMLDDIVRSCLYRPGSIAYVPHVWWHI